MSDDRKTSARSRYKFKISDEGISLRELMQALKLFVGSRGQFPEEFWSIVSSGIAGAS
jgi:hypothetical protein